MANSRQSLSEQSQRRGNLILLIIGLVLLLLFLLALCQMPSENEAPPPEDDGPLIGNRLIDWGGGEENPIEPVTFKPGEGVLEVNPSNIFADSVVGKKAEAEITLKAKNARIKLQSKKLLKEDDNFALSGSCMEKGKDLLANDEECTIIISWQTGKPTQLKNTLQIEWLEDNPRVTTVETTKIPVTVQVMDSNPCVICKCDEKSKRPDPVPEMVMRIDGKDPIPVEKGPDGPKVIIDGVEYPVPPDGPIVDPKTGKVIAVPQPKLAPLDLKNKLMGTVADNREVLDFDGKVLGRLLGDNTIINEKMEILGKAIPVVETISEDGLVFGRVFVDLDQKTIQVVDREDKTKTVGYPRVDGQVLDKDGKPLGFLSPWGLVMNFNGDILGGIVPPPDALAKKNMLVINDKSQVVGYMRPMGLAVNKKGDVVGGVVPTGVVVGGGCQSHGSIMPNGQVFDSYKQHVGHALLDKAVLDVQGNELGSVVRQGLVIDNNGKIVGFINSEGKAVNATGAMIGCVNPDGSVFAKEKFVGALMPEGRVIKEACGQVGSVYPNARVISLDLQDLGKVLPDGTAVDNKKSLGWVAPWGTTIAQDCQLLGLISLNGTVVSTEGSLLGCLTPDKKVQNVKGDIIGMVTPTGIQMNEKNQIIGRVSLDGHIINTQGAVVGCVNSSQKPILSNSTRGVVIDENGLPTGWSFVAGKTYNTLGAWMGDVTFNGWVIGDKRQLVGVVPFSGSVFSDRGEIVGHYNQMSGAVVDRAGQSIGRVLPNMSVINNSATEILGTLIPEETVFVDMQGQVLGTLRSDGVLVNQGQEIPAKILANGTMVDEKGKILGGRLPRGPVLNTSGLYIGSVSPNGSFINESGTRAGRVLSNGLVVSDQKKVLGMVFPSISTAVGIDGFLGSLNPQLVEEGEKTSYQGQINDVKGNLVGKISASGQVLGLDQNIKGNLVPIAPYVSLKGSLMGWGNFRGEVNGPDGRTIANILPSGLAISPAQQLQGMVVKSMPVVGTQGEYLGHTTSKSQLLSEKGEVLAVVGLSKFVYDTQGVLLGQILPPGIAIDGEGNLVGWTRYDGQIEDGSQVIGQVGLDGHVFDTNGQMIGAYLPMGMVEFSNTNNAAGLVNEKGNIQNVSGVEIASAMTMPFVNSKANLTGRLLENTTFTASLSSSKNQGILSNEGKVYGLTSRRETGFAMTNGFTVGSAGLVDGALLPLGSAISTTLGMLGHVYPDGNIYAAQKHVATTTGTGLVFSLAGELVGGVFKPGVIIDKKGAVVAQTGATATVMNKGKQVGNKMAFDSALTSTNKWLGNLMPRGASVDDMGHPLGVVALDGSVLNAENNFMGRVLPDGSVAGVPQKSVYNSMPYAGHTVEQGLPLGLHGDVLGRVTAMGEVLNKSNQKVGHVRDEGSIRNDASKPLGIVIPYGSAVGIDGQVLGTLSSDGKIVSFDGETVGPVLSNRTIKGAGELQTIGRLVPSELIVHDCQVVGQTAYDGRVVNGQGSVVGRIRKDRWAIDARGNEIGRVPKNGPAMTEDGQYFGRTLPDGIVVDLNGTEVACVNDKEEVIDVKTGEKFIDPLTGKGIGIIDRGLVIRDDGTITDYWIDSMGRLHAADGSVIGSILGDGKNTIVDLDGNPMEGLRVVPKEQVLIFDPDNPDKVLVTLGDNGKIYLPDGTHVGTVLDTGEIQAPNGGILPVAPGQSYGVWEDNYFIDCTLFDMKTRAKVATLMADGQLLDENGNLYGMMQADGSIFAPNGTPRGKLQGYKINLQECGLSPEKSGSRKITIRNKDYKVDKHGYVTDENDRLVATLEGGRLWDLNKQPLDPTGTVKPPKPTAPKVDSETLDMIKDKMAQKRQNMRQKLGGAPLVMSAEMQARYKPKKDKNWESLGVTGSVSSWPVDMTHVILQGRTIPAVLARSIDSRFAEGPALAIVDTNVYAEEGRNILIPAGSQLMGTYSGEDAGSTIEGVAKINITWTRLVRPDGVAFSLNAPSGDVMGRGGVAAYLDEQLVTKYGTGIMGTLAQSAIAYMMATNEDSHMSDSGNSSQSNKSQAANDARRAFIDKFGEIVDDWVAHGQAIPPVVYVPIGTRLNVILNQDLWLRSADDDEEAINNDYGAPTTSAQKPDMPSWEQNRRQQLDNMSDNQSRSSNQNDDTQKNNRNNSSRNTRNNTNQKQSQAQKDAQTMATPIYDESDRMQDDLQDRVVQPASQTPPLFN